MKENTNPLKILEVKHQISRDFGISESQIDESVLGIFLCLKSIQDKNKEQYEILTKEFKETNKKLASIKEFRRVEYSNPKTAFAGELGRLGIGITSISILLAIVISVIFNTRNNNTLIKNYKDLNTVLDVRNEGYYISKNNIKPFQNGYIITIPKEK